MPKSVFFKWIYYVEILPGELASLFGEAAIDYDSDIRRHRFRERATAIIKQLPKSDFALLKAYTRGVNQGLKYLKAPPFEYLLLQQAPC